ncbi:MAG TPA: hypothetical protein DC000_07575 [Clostridiales bacterium]|nr:hypothetical protein [Clostridiales bacterium]
MDILFSTERLNIFNATEKDIDIILELENHKDNRNYLWQGTFEEHMSEINDKNSMLVVFKRKDNNEIIGYSLSHINFKSDVFELRRIVISDKGKGYGRETLLGIIKYCFEVVKCNRFWLDVYPDNEKSINLYKSVGMHHDGTLRQSYKSERGYLAQMIFSILEEEY